MLCFDGEGRPMPAQHRQREIFERGFAPGGGATTAERRRAIGEQRRIVDLMRGKARRLELRLGAGDRRNLDECLTSIRELEEQIERNER